MDESDRNEGKKFFEGKEKKEALRFLFVWTSLLFVVADIDMDICKKEMKLIENHLLQFERENYYYELFHELFQFWFVFN